MGVEIGTLVLRGQFGPSNAPVRDTTDNIQSELDAFRRTLLRDVADMMAEAERRARER
jgi:hypothetical protein